jgi:hypothetical protein
LEADTRKVALTVLPVEDGVVIEADGHVLGAVVGNLLQNAFTKGCVFTVDLPRLPVAANGIM